MLRALHQSIGEPLLRQRIDGFVTVRGWARSLDSETPAKLALTIRVLSRDGERERGLLFPLTPIGGSLPVQRTEFNVGPLRLTPVYVDDGDRIVAELGSDGNALVEPRNDGQEFLRFSADILFEDVRTHIGDDRTTRRINQCIYCRSSEGPLSDEHIIPYGLNGPWTLLRASCEVHRELTCRFEHEVLGNMFGQARDALAMQSRNPGNRPSHLPIRVRFDDKERAISVPIVEHPAIVAFPVFLPPGKTTGNAASPGMKFSKVFFAQTAGLPLADLYAKYGGTYVGVRLEYQPVNFSKLLAKIGYGFAVLSVGLDRIEEAWVLDSMLGNGSELGQWVGCDDGQPHEAPVGLHAITIKLRGKEIHVFVRLFAQFGSPEYHVIVGRIR